jgi:spore coat protein H
MRGFPILTCLIAFAATAEPANRPQKPAQLFQETRVWTVHLRFTPEQWDAMEPKGGGGMMRGGIRGGGPGGPGGGISMLLAPTFMKDGDQDHDGKLSAKEFHDLGDTWFAQWDKRQTGKLGFDQLREGIDTTLVTAFARGMGNRLQAAEGHRNGLAGASGIDFQYVHADLEFEGQTIKDIGVRYKGNGTWMQSQGQLKRSLKLDLNHYVKGQKLAGLTKLNFHSNVTDASWMNEVLSHRLYRDAAVPAPRTAYTRVYLTVPGKHDHAYVGLYSIVEDVDKSFAKEQMGEKDGAIFKPVTPNLFADLGDDWANYKQTYDPKTELTEKQGKRLIAFAKLVSHADDTEFAARVGDYVDLGETARYLAVTVWLSTLDSILGMGQNFYVYLDPKTNKFKFLPWDLDHSFGQFGMQGNQEQREGLSIHHPWRGDNRFLDRLFKVDSFKKLYLAKMDEFDKTIFEPQRFFKQVDAIAAVIRPAVADESPEMLKRFDKVVAGEAVEPAARFGGRGGMPGANPIKRFVDARAKSVIDQVAGKSEGQALAGGFGGGGGGRGGGGGMAGPGGGPGQMLAMLFMNALDANKDSQLTREELDSGFDKWFVAWNSDKSGNLTEEQLRAGIDKDIQPSRGGGGGGGGIGGVFRDLFRGPNRGR